MASQQAAIRAERAGKILVTALGANALVAMDLRPLSVAITVCVASVLGMVGTNIWLSGQSLPQTHLDARRRMCLWGLIPLVAVCAAFAYFGILSGRYFLVLLAPVCFRHQMARSVPLIVLWYFGLGLLAGRGLLFHAILGTGMAFLLFETRELPRYRTWPVFRGLLLCYPAFLASRLILHHLFQIRADGILPGRDGLGWQIDVAYIYFCLMFTGIMAITNRRLRAIERQNS